MCSLKDLDRKEFLDSQPISKAAMEVLQQKALDGDSESKDYFRKYTIGLGIYIAKEEAEKNALDLDYLLEHINVDKLEEAGYRKSFSVFQNETIHIDTIRAFIYEVINSIFTKTLNGQYIKTEFYKKVADTLDYNQLLSSTLETVIDGIPGEIINAIKENEIQINTQRIINEVCSSANESLFGRLKLFIRDCDLPYGKKLNLLINLTQGGAKIRSFFCYLCGIDDGAVKTLEETAYHFDISVERAMQIYTNAIHNNYSRFLRPARHDDPYIIRDLNDFLCEKEYNRKEREKFEETIREYHRRLRNYLG